MSSGGDQSTSPFLHSTNPFLQSTNPFVDNVDPWVPGETSSNANVKSPEDFIDNCYRQYVGESLPVRRPRPPPRSSTRRQLHSTAAHEQFTFQPPVLSEPLHSISDEEQQVPRPDQSRGGGETTEFLLRTLVNQFSSAIKEANVKSTTTSSPIRQVELRLPRFDGTSDVHLFIKQFEQVARLSNWNERIAIVQLRSCLDRAAKDCGQADSVRGVFSRLLAMYGLSPAQAREMLHSLTREPNESYVVLGNRVDKLAKLAYGGLGSLETQMALEHFDRALDHPSLRQHMLLVKPRSLDEAVKAAEQFALVSRQPSRPPRSRDRIAPVDASCAVSPPSQMKVVEVQGTSDALTKMVQSMQTTLEEQSRLIKEQNRRISAMETRPRFGYSAQSRDLPRSRSCYVCGDPSHFQRHCPKRSGITGPPTPSKLGNA